jgi:hypothetical protein
MTFVKLKQVESGAALLAVLAATHPAAVVTNNAAPFAFNAVAQALNLPQAPSMTVVGNTVTFTPGDGTLPVVYTPTIAADIFVQAGVYNNVLEVLELTLSSGSVLSIPMSDLVPVAVLTSQTILFGGNGTNANPITAQVIFSAATNNLAVNDGTGLFVGLTTQDTTTIKLTGQGTVSTPLAAVVQLDSTVGNQLVDTGTGLFVAPSLPVGIAPTETIDVLGNGTSTPFELHVKVQPDGATSLNYLHSANGNERDNSAEAGLGYTQGVAYFQGDQGPFDLLALLPAITDSWTGTPQIVRVDGYINGVLYPEQNNNWDYANWAAVAWLDTPFTLDARDEVRFVMHVRAA